MTDYNAAIVRSTALHDALAEIEGIRDLITSSNGCRDPYLTVPRARVETLNSAWDAINALIERDEQKLGA